MHEIKLSFFYKFVSKILQKCGHLIIGAASLLEKCNSSEEMQRWFEDNGDKTHRIFYEELNNNSLVFDLGGYEGQWASDIYSMYCCKVHIFELVIPFAEKIEKRFSKNSDIIIHRFGLPNKDKIVEICIDRDGSSIFRCRVPQLMSVLLTEFMSAFDIFSVLVEIDFVVID